MIKSAQELLDWLTRCPEGRAVSLRYISDPGVVGYSFAVEHIDGELLREIAEIASEDLLFIPCIPTVQGPAMPNSTYMDAVDMPARPQSNAMIIGLEALKAEPEPIKRIADPLRDPKLDWMRSKGK